MRPSINLDPGLFVPTSERAGTGRHTLPDGPNALLEQGDRISLGGVAEDFFNAGEVVSEPEPELELEPARPRVVRTPEMDARRARLVRVVATVVGCFAGVLALGVVRASAAERAAEKPSVPVTAPAKLAPAVVAKAPEPRSEPAPVEAAAPREEQPQPATPKRATPAKIAAPAAPVPVAPAPTPAPRQALPSVASFAARSGDPVKSASKPPTASF